MATIKHKQVSGHYNVIAVESAGQTLVAPRLLLRDVISGMLLTDFWCRELCRASYFDTKYATIQALVPGNERHR